LLFIRVKDKLQPKEKEMIAMNPLIKTSVAAAALRSAFIRIAFFASINVAQAIEVNTPYGDHALWQVTRGERNSAFGVSAVFWGDTGGSNTGVGTNAPQSNHSGNGNAAVGGPREGYHRQLQHPSARMRFSALTALRRL